MLKQDGLYVCVCVLFFIQEEMYYIFLCFFLLVSILEKKCISKIHLLLLFIILLCAF